MASARYTLNIKPKDLKPDEPRQLTKKEKLANWWYYHRLHVAVAAAALAVAVWIAVDLLGRTFPDYQLALVTDQYVPETVVEELQTALVPFCQDLNGDGQVLAEIAAYQLELDESSQVDAYTHMAGFTRLTADLATDTALIFLVDKPMELQASFNVLAAADGSATAEDRPGDAALYAFSDCPALAGLALSEEARDFFDDFYLARRSFAPGEELAEYPAENEALFAALTQGAAAG